MGLIFDPDPAKQNGVFKYLFNRFGDKIKNYVEIYGTNHRSTTLFSIINESYPGRYISDENTPNNFYLVFRKFSVKISHYSIRSFNNYCFTKEWNIYDLTNNANKLVSNGKFTKCGNGKSCSGDQIQIFEVSSTPLIRSLKFDQVGLRSSNQQQIEFKSMEIYGTLMFDKDYLKTRPNNLYFHQSIMMLVFLVY